MTTCGSSWIAEPPEAAPSATASCRGRRRAARPRAVRRRAAGPHDGAAARGRTGGLRAHPSDIAVAPPRRAAVTPAETRPPAATTVAITSANAAHGFAAHADAARSTWASPPRGRGAAVGPMTREASAPWPARDVEPVTPRKRAVQALPAAFSAGGEQDRPV